LIYGILTLFGWAVRRLYGILQFRRYGMDNEENIDLVQEISSIVAQARALGIIVPDVDKILWMRQDERNAILEDLKKNIELKPKITKYEKERRKQQRIKHEFWEFHRNRQKIQDIREELRRIPDRLKTLDKRLNLFKANEDFNIVNEIQKQIDKLSLKSPEYKKEEQELIQEIEDEVARLEEMTDLDFVEREIVESNTKVLPNLKKILQGIEEQEEDAKSGILKLIQQASKGDKTVQNEIYERFKLFIERKSKYYYLHRLKRKNIKKDYEKDKAKNDRIGIVPISMFYKVDSKKSTVVEVLLKKGDLKKVSLIDVCLKKVDGKPIRRPQELLDSKFDEIWDRLSDTKRREKDPYQSDLESTGYWTLVQIIHGGTIAKSNFNEIGSNGMIILNELLKNDIVEEIADKKVSLKVNLIHKENKVREIAKEDFDKTWELLLHSQEWRKCKFSGITKYIESRIDESLKQFVNRVYQERDTTTSIGDFSNDISGGIGPNQDNHIVDLEKKNDGEKISEKDDIEVHANQAEKEVKDSGNNLVEETFEEETKQDRKLKYSSKIRVVPHNHETPIIQAADRIGVSHQTLINWHDGNIFRAKEKEYVKKDYYDPLTKKWVYKIEKMKVYWEEDFPELIRIKEEQLIIQKRGFLPEHGLIYSSKLINNLTDKYEKSIKIDHFQYREDEFKKTMPPTALIKALEKVSGVNIPKAKVPIESLNLLLNDPKLIQVMKVRPDECLALIESLESGHLLNPYEVRWLNKILIEENFPTESPKRYNRDKKMEAIRKDISRLEEVRPNTKKDKREIRIYNEEDVKYFARELGIELDNTDSFKFDKSEFGEEVDSPQEFIAMIMDDLKRPQPQIDSVEAGIEWLNQSIEPYQLIRNENNIDELEPETKKLIKNIQENYQVSSFLELTPQNLRDLTSTPQGHQLKREILNTFYPHHLTPIIFPTNLK
jgi:hypothetical protein